MTRYYHQGIPLKDLCIDEGLKYEYFLYRMRKGMTSDEIEYLIRRPVRMHSGIYGGQAKYVHDCPDCAFMGHTNGFDLYSCTGYHGQVEEGDNPVWIRARSGDHPWDISDCRLGFAYKNILMIAENLYRGLNDGIN